MINVDSEFKNRTKKIKQQSIKLGILDGELTVKEVHFMPVKQFNALPVWMLRARKKVIAKGLKYSFEGNLFKTIMKQIEITVKNAAELKDKNVNFQYGIYIDNDFQYINLGNYYIKDIEDNKGKSELIVTGYDKMINFMKTFKQSDLQLTYPCTMLALIQKMCEVCGVELYSTNFFNSDLVVNEDYFTAQELTYRDVLEKVAETTETTIFIKDNKLCLHKLANNPVEKLDASYLTGLTVKEKFGPVNALVLGRGDVEDNVEARDDTSIAQNGRCEIRFDENEFVEYQREQVIDEMFEQIKGLEYYSFEGSDVGVMWLEPCDLIEVEDSEENTYKTIYLSANITINTGISSDIEAGIPEETNTEYKVTTKEEKKTLKVERLAKKNEGLIQDVIEQQTETTTKLTKVEQDIDSITQTVSSIETKVETVEDKADSAQEVADNATKQIETTTKKLSQIEQTVDNITQTVSSVETKVETVENKADTAQSTANKAQSTANTANTNAQNAQKTANNATTQITTTNQKVSQIEQTVSNITQSVSEVEEKVETVEGKADTAQNTANTANATANQAKNTANSTNNNLTTNYYTKTETNSQINQKADSITSSVSKTYSTKTETANAKNEAINSANASTDKKLEEYTVTEELGTVIEQNWEHVKVAWNQISDYIQMMIMNGTASLAILDQSGNVLMSLDKEGQNFYKSGQTTPFGEMGVKTVDGQNYISFSVLGEYGQTIQDGMAWGITIKDDNKFLPILYIKDFAVGNQGSETGSGKLVLNSCDIVLDNMGAGIEANNVKIHGDAMPGIFFTDVDTGKNLMSVMPDVGSVKYATISLLDNISFYRNQAGSNSFKIGNSTGTDYCLFSDNGYIHGDELDLTAFYFRKDGVIVGNADFSSLPKYQRKPLVYGGEGHTYHMEWNASSSKLEFYVDVTNVGSLSDKRIKTEIKDIDNDFINAIEEIEMKQFKVANRNGLISFGILAQDLMEIFEKYNKNPFDYEIVYETKYRTDDDTVYYAIDYTQFLVLKQKATDVKLKKLEEENKEKDKLLQDLIARVEKLEGGNNE